MKHICLKCKSNKVDIMSCEKISEKDVKIIYICPLCGYMESEVHYLYKINNKKEINQYANI